MSEHIKTGEEIEDLINDSASLNKEGLMSKRLTEQWVPLFWLKEQIVKMKDKEVAIRNQQFGSPSDYEIMSHRIGVLSDVLSLLEQEEK